MLRQPGKEDEFVVEDFMVKLLGRTALRQLEMAIPAICLTDKDLHVVEPRPFRLLFKFVQVASERLRAVVTCTERLRQSPNERTDGRLARSL